MSKISLENMEFHAFHGCLEHEKTLGNTFIVSITMELDTKLAAETDNLEHTLNYQLVYDVVKTQMQLPSQLIEHIAERILDHLMRSFPLNPPLGGKVDRVTIQLSKTKVISL